VFIMIHAIDPSDPPSRLANMPVRPNAGFTRWNKRMSPQLYQSSDSTARGEYRGGSNARKNN
jgi:hypothetical protein